MIQKRCFGSGFLRKIIMASIIKTFVNMSDKSFFQKLVVKLRPDN